MLIRAAVVSGVLLAASTVVAFGGSSPRAAATAYDLFSSYPNAHLFPGYFLRGVNGYGSATSGPVRTSLWFQPVGSGAFKQFNTTPYRECHWDLLRWQPGKSGQLVYLETRAECFSDHTDIAFRPGIAYMPRTWTQGERWSTSGVSSTVFSDDGVVVCSGTNSWRSRVVGLTRMPNGEPAVHTQTNETQVLSPVPGAPSSSACPAGEVTSFGWQENFYVGRGLIVRGQDGTPVGSGPGLLRSTGGSTDETRAVGHPQWNSVFSTWLAKPPADAGTVATTTAHVAPASTGNTITVTYTAPAGGVQDGSLTLVLPPGWTPPVTTDAAGCTTATHGTVTTDGQAITVSLTLPSNGQVIVSYGATAGGSCAEGDGAEAPTITGAPLWQAQVRLRPGSTFTNLSSSFAIDVTGG